MRIFYIDPLTLFKEREIIRTKKEVKNIRSYMILDKYSNRIYTYFLDFVTNYYFI